MAVKTATTTTFDQRCDSIARSRRTIKKNVLSKKPNDSSTRANAIIAANVRPILDHPSARILSGLRPDSAPTNPCPNRMAARINSRIASTVGKNPVCGTRILPNERCRLCIKRNAAHPKRTSETASWERFIESELGSRISTADFCGSDDLRPFVLFFEVKFRGVLRAKILNERLGLFDLTNNLGIF